MLNQSEQALPLFFSLFHQLIEVERPRLALLEFLDLNLELTCLAAETLSLLPLHYEDIEDAPS